MKKKLWIGIGIVLLVGILIGINVWQGQAGSSVKVETSQLEKETMKETVMVPGTLKLNKEQNIYYEAEKGEIAEVFVEEGDTVEKGTEIVRYENKQLELEKKQNDLQLRSSSLEINNLRKKHKEIDKQLERDKDNEMLQEEHDQIKLQQQQATIELERIQLQKEAIEQQMAALVVTSDIAGKVVSVDEEATASTEQMQRKPLVRIGSLNDLIVEGTISEYDTLKIKEGQNVILTSDAVPDEEWSGKVSLVADLPDQSGEMQDSTSGVQYSIIVTVEDDIHLKPGFQMLIEIETSKQETTTLPLQAVQQEEDTNFVYVVENNRAVKKEVKIGSVTTERIEIKDGLEEDDHVIVNPADITAGMEVEAK
ncbi:efflux RND transporter periplasmic adaptor subunit [Virgibacillus sp. W0430]|uniref:efflux RND transporter periplasmic adaptor subunit n=1 Tax=Virgibacillus sp. W0430 TaxID=3391580 RepID=UPI003F48A350